MHAFLVVGPPVLVLLSAYCFWWTFTAESSGGGISEGEGIAANLVGGAIGLLLLTAAVLALAAVLSKDVQESVARLARRLAAVGLLLFPGWLLWTIVISVSIST